jgi:predicted metal-dependent phosphoesterase TrpH
MLKAELHAHTDDDPRDAISYSARELIDCAAALEYDVLAITLHDRWQDCQGLQEYAQSRGVVLIPGVERTIERRHVLLLNGGPESETLDSFAALAEWRSDHPDALVVAPHPFYPGSTCLRAALDEYAALFDAVEFNAFYTPRFNRYNTLAVEWAVRHGKPVVANSDVHRLHQLGRTYSLIDAQPTAASICAAIKAGGVQICTEPLTPGEAVAHLSDLLFSELLTATRRRLLPMFQLVVPAD